MMEGAVIAFVIVCFCGLIMWAVALWSLKKKTPMHFWAGTTVPEETITDVKKYNRANAWMWFLYGAAMMGTGASGFFVSAIVFTVINIIVPVGGLFILVIVYNIIYKKYRKDF